MFVLGIDPGLSRCGYGVVALGPGGRATAVAYGVVRTPVDVPIPQRLAILQRDVESLLADHPPAVVAVERLFFQVNARTAIGVAKAAGVVEAAAALAGCEVVEYTPNQVKESVTGDGAAPKAAVATMVQRLLALPAAPAPADAADALAVALCHAAHAPVLARASRATEPVVSPGTLPR